MENKLNELKTKKMEYLLNIYDLTLKQKEALEIEDIEGLQRLINDKQVYMLKINQVDQELNQLEERYLKKVDENCKKILSAIIEADNLNRQKADQLFQALKEKIGKVRQGKKVHNAYNPSLANSAFINKAR